MIWIRANNRALRFALSNTASKGLAAIAQLYAIFVFTRIHTRDDAAIIFLLLGYAVWFQVFEFGLSQSIQNKFNAKLVSCGDTLKILFTHLFSVWAIALIALTTPSLANLLLPNNFGDGGTVTMFAFSIGSAMLLIASNNVITQKLLLIFNQEYVGSILTLSQSLLTILGLAIYNLIDKPNLSLGVLLYFGPQVITYLPILAHLMIKLLKKSPKRQTHKILPIFIDSISFFGLGVLSALYLGLDYYYAAHLLNSEQVVSYHLTTRLFFISYVAYFAFAQHRVRRLSYANIKNYKHNTPSIFKDSILVGLGCVISVYSFAIILKIFGAFDSLTNGVEIRSNLLTMAFVYFLVRVFRDVALVIAGTLNFRKVLYQVYFIELSIALSLMPLIVPKYGGAGIYASMSLASISGFLLLLHFTKKVGH